MSHDPSNTRVGTAVSWPIKHKIRTKYFNDPIHTRIGTSVSWVQYIKNNEQVFQGSNDR
jgi:hypothetical protein